MKNKGKVKTFSGKKLALTILCTVIVSVFIGTTIFFCKILPYWTEMVVIMNLDNDSEELIKIGKEYQQNLEHLEEQFKESKDLYGEDYPAEGIFLFKLVNLYSPGNMIIEVYTTALLVGIALGTIIYIVAVQNIKEKQMVIELVVVFIILVILIICFNFGYEVIINKGIKALNPDQVKYSTYIYDLESNNYLLAQYIVVAIIIYIINMVRQKILINKLNKELNNK